MIVAATTLMNAARDQFFADSGLAMNQHSRIGGCDHFDLIEHAMQPEAIAQQSLVDGKCRSSADIGIEFGRRAVGMMVRVRSVSPESRGGDPLKVSVEGVLI